MSILTNNQKNILAIISKEKNITDHFYLSGGTALAEFYLQHRLSEDLDFFSQEEFDPQAIFVFFKKIQKEASIVSIEYQQSFNRNLFFLKLADDVIKTEFTYYPFQRVEEGQKNGALKVDSLLDIAINKIFTIYQQPRSRDFIDLYCILQKEKSWTIGMLVKQAHIKFDNYLDPLLLSSQFVKAQVLKDYPKMLTDIKLAEWQDFFIEQSKTITKSQIK